MLKKFLAKLMQRFKIWLTRQRSFVSSWYTKDKQQAQEPEKTLIELPPELRAKLKNAIDNLDSSSADKEAIQLALNERFEQWHSADKEANNCLVILGSPVASVSRIITESIAEWTETKQVAIRLLPWVMRPEQTKEIQPKLENYLGHSHDQPEIVVIPNLSWCFLRSVDGLDSIEYLQSLICQNSQQRFWLIGGGQVGWGYLKSVTNIADYCGEVFSPPKISGEKLEEWLLPVIDQLAITFDKPAIDLNPLDGDKGNRTNYFKRLAKVSKGVSTVAVQFFLQSIRYIEPEEIGVDVPPTQGVLIAQNPTAPELPELQSQDLYLLYSLILHGDLNIAALAESLGDNSAQVQGQVIVLRSKGLIEQQGETIKINPIYYPKLKEDLARNNFIINDP